MVWYMSCCVKNITGIGDSFQFKRSHGLKMYSCQCFVVLFSTKNQPSFSLFPRILISVKNPKILFPPFDRDMWKKTLKVTRSNGKKFPNFFIYTEPKIGDLLNKLLCRLGFRSFFFSFDWWCFVQHSILLVYLLAYLFIASQQ